MRVLFCTTGGLGHMLPLRPLARALHHRGHEVAWATAPDALPVLEGEGFDLFAAGLTFEASRRQFRAAFAEAARFAGETLSAYTFPRLFGAVLGPAMLKDVERTGRHWRPDFVVHEPAALVAPLVCRRLGLRNVVHGYGLRPPREYLEDAMSFFGPYWQACGLEPSADGGLYRHLSLDIAPRSLQPLPVPEEKGVFRFNAYRAAGTAPPAPPADLGAALQGPAAPRPRIYVTFGTVFNRSPALVAAARAAARVGGSVVVTIGADGDTKCLADLGAQVHVRRFVDQAALLPHCDVVVSHGGAGTMLGAAAHGVPHLVLPQAADHFRNARAIESAHAGSSMDPERQTAALVASALAALLESGALAIGAAAVAQEMAALPDPVAAAAKLETWQAAAPATPGCG
ncbi:glycosyltransferase [Roseateles sp.]|uniref:glycosyltransferase n=1 Tax=Roseateles sp. TaxID=1971397 RepID=UPI0039EBFD8E